MILRTSTDERADKRTDGTNERANERTNEQTDGERVAIETLIPSLSHPRHATAVPATGGRKNSEGEKPGGDSNKKTDQY